jgi:hypothetical protein
MMLVMRLPITPVAFSGIDAFVAIVVMGGQNRGNYYGDKTLTLVTFATIALPAARALKS